MKIMHDPFRLAIVEDLHPLVGEHLSKDQIYDLLVLPPQANMGDLAFGVFQLAKVLKKGPPIIAKELAEKFKQIKVEKKYDKVEAAGPYLNFFFASDFYGEKLLKPIEQGTFFSTKLTENNPKVMIEYSQPNTHKELHVGHMRNACLGDALVRTMRYVGMPIISSTFPGDVGTHVAKCLWYLKYHNTEPVPASGKGEWLGRIYSKAHLKLEDEEKTEKYEQNKKQLTEILQQLEKKNGEYYELWKETKQWSLELMQSVYAWAGIQFDQWYWESDVDAQSVQYAKTLFQQGKLVQSEGAIGMDFTSENLGFCLLLKSDGTGLYATKDVELARRKFEDHKIDKSIYVVDMRQELHFKQVFKVLERIGFEKAKDCFHLQYNFVELPDGAMSSRKGNIVPLMRLVEKMEQMVLEKYLSRYKDEWQDTEMKLVAKQVAQGAIKYGMLKIDTNKKIVFDMEEWLKIDGDSGPFIQYSAARIQSLCRKLNFQKSQSINWQLLNHTAEKSLMQLLFQFNTVVNQVAETYRPSVLCSYLFDLAQRFNLFYHECSVGQAETEELKKARLSLSHATGEVLQKGLSLLGIPAPEKM